MTTSEARNPSGSSVTMKVIGVLDHLSSSETASNNDLAVVPLSTYQQRLVGGANRESLGSIYVKANSAASLTQIPRSRSRPSARL
jgi:hypothetical protein